MHRGAFCQLLFRWIYCYDSNKSTGKKAGKTHLCAVQWSDIYFWYPFASDHNHCAMLSFIISLYYKHCSSFCGTTSLPLPPWAKERMRKLGCRTHSLTSFILCLKHKVQVFKEGKKSLIKFPICFDVYLLNVQATYLQISSNICGLLRKHQL